MFVGRLIDCHHAQKPQNCHISDLFDLTSKYFLPLLPYTDLAPPSTDPVPPSTNQYRPILIQYHQVSTTIAPYWPSTFKYQPVSPSTNAVPPSNNRYRLLLTKCHHISTILHHSPLTQYHQVSTSAALY